MLRRLRELALALVCALGLVAVIELALGMLGVGKRAVGALGYDAGAAYLVPNPHGSGWRTQFEQEGFEEVDLPPKGDEVRVLISGASTAHSFWAGRLHEHLNERFETDVYHEYNLGRGGYGSERVLIIAEQALDRVAPDLLVVYTGDNEFVEVPPADREHGWSERLANLRTVRGVMRLVNGEPPHPEPWIPFFGPKTLLVQYETTLARLEGLRENLRGLCRAAREHDVPMVLSTVVYNRLAAPFVSNFPAGMSQADREEFGRLTKAASELLPSFLEPIRVVKATDRVQIKDWTSVTKPDPAARDRWDLPGRRPATGPFTDVKPYGTAAWRRHERVWNLFVALERFHARDVDASERKRLERAETLYEQALLLHGEHSRTHFELGLVRYLLGRDAREVVATFERACTFDRLPLKGNALINAIITEVAAEFPEVLLFDADKLFRERMPGGLWGWEWMLDHCHMTRGARMVFMQDMTAAIAERWPDGLPPRR